jgi:hypothetical protein
MLDEEEDTCHKDSPDESGSKGNSIKPKHTRLPSTTPSMASLITCTLNACVCVSVCLCVCVCVCVYCHTFSYMTSILSSAFIHAQVTGCCLG